MLLLDLQFGVECKKGLCRHHQEKKERRFWLQSRFFFSGKEERIPLNPHTAGAASFPSRRRPSGPRKGERTTFPVVMEKKKKTTLHPRFRFPLHANYQPLSNFSNCESRQQVGGRSPPSPWHLFPRHFHYHNRFMK